MITVTRSFHFEAAHFLPGHPKCGTMHGHSYRVDVTVSGPIGENGMVIDFGDLKRVVMNAIEPYDHRVINEVFDKFVMLVPPTAEFLADHFAREIAFGLAVIKPSGKLQLESVRVWETSDAYAEWRYDVR